MKVAVIDYGSGNLASASRALRAALAIDPRKPNAVPSTKGVLGGTLA